MNDDRKIELDNLQTLESYLKELLIDNFIGIDVDDNFICKIPNFPDERVVITKLQIS